MMYDKEFLLNLDRNKNKTIYARIIALNLQEQPIESIEGRVTQGSISLDGASAVRRTCSLTITAQEFDYSNYLWGLNTKFALEIGVLNTINSSYPEIIWFKQGIYFISSFNMSRSTNNFSITIQGKDKMSMLNGEMGGTINSSVDFGTIEEEDQNGNWVIRKIPIKEIIRNIVHQYAGEPLHNIIINDIPDSGLELLEYRYEIPMYLYRKIDNTIYENATLDGDIKCFVDGDEKTFSELTSEELDQLVTPLFNHSSPKAVRIDNDFYYIAKVEYGQTAGYRKTELTYAGDLIANVGETVVSVLDKIKNMLGEFEYFYDLDGYFVFQQKQSFVNTIYGQSEDKESIQKIYIDANITAYDFFNGELITQFNNNPNSANVKNDYSIWGQRTTTSGAQVPIHLRYAIDYKPLQYKSIFVDDNEDSADKKAINAYNKKYGTTLSGQESVTYISADVFNKTDSGDIVYCDWREVIYQMALDYYKYNHLDDFEVKVAAANPNEYPLGMTGYEQYYIDLQGFWRQLYDPTLDSQIASVSNKITEANNRKTELEAQITNKRIAVNISSQVEFNNIKAIYGAIYSGLTSNSTVGGYSPSDNITYYVNAKDSDLTNLTDQLNYETAIKDSLDAELKALNAKKKYEYYSDEDNYSYWHRSVFEQPEALNFWFDFLDSTGELNQFNVKSIGCRPKAVNDTNIKAIYFRETPNILFVEEKPAEIQTGYRYICAPGILTMFSISAQGKSAKTKLDELIYQHGYCAESATINCIPIYYLQPNILIKLVDEETNLNGNYNISKISIPLTYNGTMSLTATKVAEAYLH